MMTTDEIQKALQEPFSGKDIEWRVGSTNKDKTRGLALAYVTNRAIQRRLDEVMSCAGWRNEYQDWKGKGVLCGLSLHINDEWITKWDGADEPDFEPTKGGLSDSMKRAAYQWGIGRYLYELESEWVEIEQHGNTSFIKRGCYPVLPTWALPAGEKPQPKSTGSSPPVPPPPLPSTGSPLGKPPRSGTISDAQAKRLYAILKGAQRDPYEAKIFCRALYGYTSSKEIQWRDYDAICKWAGEPKSDESVGEKVASWLDEDILSANLNDEVVVAIQEKAGIAPFANTEDWTWKEAAEVYAAVEAEVERRSGAA